MIGRASHGAPWIFGAVNATLREGRKPPALQRGDVRDIILAHLDSLYALLRRGDRSPDRAKTSRLVLRAVAEVSGAHAPELMGAANTAAQFAHAVKHFDDWVSEAAVAA